MLFCMSQKEELIGNISLFQCALAHWNREIFLDYILEIFVFEILLSLSGILKTYLKGTPDFSSQYSEL